MAWIKIKTNIYICLCIFFASLFLCNSELSCGYPGSPAFGRPIPIREQYGPGSTISYVCAYGYTLRGSPQRICLNNGTWKGIIPICDQSLRDMQQHASTRSVYDQQFTDSVQNIIDGDKNTCTYTNPVTPRWVRVDLQQNYLIEAVSITVPKSMYVTDAANLKIFVISVKNSTRAPYTSSASYHKCAEFSGKFSSPTIKLPCAVGGFYGRYIHIEDRRNIISYFAVCEIDIFVQKDLYECGEPDRPSHSYTSNPEAGVVEYRCVHGYHLEGAVRRRCLANGQWSGEQPLCTEIICPKLPSIDNGIIQYAGPVKGKLVLDTFANVSCEHGYQTNGEAFRCLETGLWSEGHLECKAVDCQIPVIRNNMEKYVLLNESTVYGSMALLYCGDKKPMEDDSLTSLRTCREDGIWSDISLDCTLEDNSLKTLGLIEDDENAVPNSVIISMAVVVFILLIVLIFILLFRKRQLSRRQSIESLPSKDTSSSLTMPEIKNGVPYENDAFYASITANGSKQEIPNEPRNDSPVKNENHKIVERGILSTILFAKRRTLNNEKHKPKPDTSNSNICFYEEVGHNPEIRKSIKQAKKTVSEEDSCDQPVYAQVDLDQKRKSRLAKTTVNSSDATCSMEFGPPSEKLTETYRKEEVPNYDSELDSDVVVLRELPPIPDDDDQSSGTYASLSRPPEPPYSSTPTFMRDNDIYEAAATTYEIPRHHIMKDNDVYST